MKKKTARLSTALIALALCCSAFTGCNYSDDTTQSDDTVESAIYVNGSLVSLSADGNTDLDLLSVENGITVYVEKVNNEEIYVNGKAVDNTVTLDVSTINRNENLTFEVVKGDTTKNYTVNLMPSTFPDYTVEGESTTDGDYYMSTYDLSTNYIFKLNNIGELIFYKKVTKIDDEGNEVSVNGLDFRKEYTSDGEIRYTYMPYLAEAFADGDCAGINPGCVVVMDENYNVVDEIYYLDGNGEEIMIDPHGFIWIDEGHYIVTAYKQLVLDVPEDLGATDNSADLAVLYIQEVKENEVLWEFSTKDYEQFLYESNSVTWSESTERCYDYVHFNSMSIDKDDNLLVSCRHLDSILKISRENGTLMWQLGGDNDNFGLTEDQQFSYQHSIIVSEDGDYMLFDNANTAVAAGNATYSSVIRMTVDETNMSVTDFTRHQVVDYYSLYMGAIRELDYDNAVYLWSVGGNYNIDNTTPPAWSMVEYTVTDNGEVEHKFRFKFNQGTGRLYCANKCE